jgi:hypothetical protein
VTESSVIICRACSCPVWHQLSEILWHGYRTQFWEFPNSEKCILKRGLETNMMHFSVFVLSENWES